MTDRKRVNLSLSPQEFEQLNSMSVILGFTVTNVVYEAYRLGLSQLLDAHNKKQANIGLALDRVYGGSVSVKSNPKRVIPKNNKKRKKR